MACNGQDIIDNLPIRHHNISIIFHRISIHMSTNTHQEPISIHMSVVTVGRALAQAQLMILGNIGTLLYNRIESN